MSAITSQAKMSGLRFLARDEVSSFATSTGIVVCFGRAAPKGNNVPQFFEAVDKGLARYPKGAGLMMILHDASTPDADARNALKDRFPMLSRDLVGTAFILRAKGFTSAAQRAIITAVMLATGNRSKVVALSGVQEGVEWIYSRLPEKVQSKTTPARVLAKEIIAFCDEELALAAKS